MVKFKKCGTLGNRRGLTRDFTTDLRPFENVSIENTVKDALDLLKTDVSQKVCHSKFLSVTYDMFIF